MAHMVLAWSALQFARGNKKSAGADGSSEAAGVLLTWDVGGIVLGLIGIGFAAADCAVAPCALFLAASRRPLDPLILWRPAV